MNDFIIIGGGLSGLSIAYWLEKKNYKVTLIEEVHLGFGASGRNAGFLTGGSITYFSHLLETYGKERALEIWDFTTSNVALIKEELKLKDKMPLSEKGTTSLITSEENEKVSYAFKILKEAGFKTQVTTNDFNYPFAYQILTDASMNPNDLIKVLRESLKKTTIIENCRLKKLYKNSNSFDLETSTETLQSKKIIFATNSLLYQFLPELKDIVKPTRAQISEFRILNLSIREGNFLIPSERIYFRKYNDGLIMGGLRFVDPENENTEVMEINEKIQNALSQKVEKFFGKHEIVRQWSGIMGFTFDEQPLYGQSANDPDIYYMGGFSGHGNGYAFKLAGKLVDML